MPRFEFSVEIKADTQGEAYKKLSEVDGVDEEDVNFVGEYPDEAEEVVEEEVEE